MYVQQTRAVVRNSTSALQELGWIENYTQSDEKQVYEKPHCGK